MYINVRYGKQDITQWLGHVRQLLPAHTDKETKVPFVFWLFSES